MCLLDCGRLRPRVDGIEAAAFFCACRGRIHKMKKQKPSNPEGPLLNTREAAEYLRVSTWFVLDHTRGGKEPIIPNFMLSRNSRRFVREDLDRFVAKLAAKS